LLGLDEQLEQWKETDDYLFRNGSQTDNSPNIFNPGNPKGGGSGAVTKESILKIKDVAKRQQKIQENIHLFR